MNRCPQCGAGIESTGGSCGRCGYGVVMVRVYKPAETGPTTSCQRCAELEAALLEAKRILIDKYEFEAAAKLLKALKPKGW